MAATRLQSALTHLVVVLVLSAFSASHAESGAEARDPGGWKAMPVHYLEIVTPDVDATCSALETLHGVTFGQPDTALGNARTATLNGGGMIGVRAPMHEGEPLVVRPYVLVDDIDAAVDAAAKAGAQIIVPSMELPGHGKCAIYFLGGIQHGLWQK